MNTCRFLVVVAMINFLCTGAQAHHAIFAHFDSTKTFEIEGVLTEFRMSNPHAFFFLEVTDDEGDVRNWEVELPSTVHLRRMGVSQSTFEPGDRIEVSGFPNRDPENSLVYGRRFLTADGETYGSFSDITVDSNSDAVQNAEAVAGRWLSPTPRYNPQPLLPLNEAGSAAAANYDPQLSPATTCEPGAIPNLQLFPYLTDIRIQDDRVIFHHEAYDVVRSIPLDAPAAQVEPLGNMGVASAHIEGKELVIESSGYPPSRWGLAGAAQPRGGSYDVPSSAQKKVVERYSVSDEGQTLTLAQTIEDPVYLTEVYSASLTMSRVADDEPMYPFECETDSAKRFSE
jgi:hypothetical protein